MGSPRSLKNKVLATRSGQRMKMLRCIQSLVHASQCRNTNCSFFSCQKMKRVVLHTKDCKRKIDGGCPMCKQLITMCCYHAKHCQNKHCSVPFCLIVKNNLNMMLQRLQQAQPADAASPATATAPGTPNSEQQPSTPQTPQPMPSQPQQQQPGMMPQHLVEDGIDPIAFQEMKRILLSPRSPQKQQQIRTILEANPNMILSFNKFMKAKNQASQPQALQQQSPQAIQGALPGMQSGQVQRPEPQGMSPVGPRGQMMNAAHNGNSQLDLDELQGHGQFPQQQPGPASYLQLPMQQQMAMQGGEGPIGQLPPHGPDGSTLQQPWLQQQQQILKQHMGSPAQANSMSPQPRYEASPRVGHTFLATLPYIFSLFFVPLLKEYNFPVDEKYVVWGTFVFARFHLLLNSWVVYSNAVFLTTWSQDVVVHLDPWWTLDLMLRNGVLIIYNFSKGHAFQEDYFIF